MSTAPTTTTVTVNVTQLDPEDYFDQTGNAGLAIELAEKHNAVQTGGGTDFTTGLSDMDFEIDVVEAFAFTAALDAHGLSWRVFVDDEDDD